MHRNSALITDRLKGILSDLSSFIGQDSSSDAQPVCESRDWDSFVQRVRSFHSASWFAKPAWLSPIVCSRYGWRNIDVDLLRCVGCQALLVVRIPSSFDPAIYAFCKKRLEDQLRRSAHHPCCTWPSCPTPEVIILARGNGRSQADVVKDFVAKACLLYSVGKALPVVEHLRLNVTESDITALCSLVRSNSDLLHDVEFPFVLQSAVLLALVGWELNAGDNTFTGSTSLHCTLCMRQPGLWNYINVAEGNDTVAAVGRHHNDCEASLDYAENVEKHCADVLPDISCSPHSSHDVSSDPLSPCEINDMDMITDNILSPSAKEDTLDVANTDKCIKSVIDDILTSTDVDECISTDVPFVGQDSPCDLLSSENKTGISSDVVSGNFPQFVERKNINDELGPPDNDLASDEVEVESGVINMVVTEGAEVVETKSNSEGSDVVLLFASDELSSHTLNCDKSDHEIDSPTENKQGMFVPHEYDGYLAADVTDNETPSCLFPTQTKSGTGSSAVSKLGDNSGMLREGLHPTNRFCGADADKEQSGISGIGVVEETLVIDSRNVRIGLDASCVIDDNAASGGAEQKGDNVENISSECVHNLDGESLSVVMKLETLKEDANEVCNFENAESPVNMIQDGFIPEMESDKEADLTNSSGTQFESEEQNESADTLMKSETVKEDVHDVSNSDNVESPVNLTQDGLIPEMKPLELTSPSVTQLESGEHNEIADEILPEHHCRKFTDNQRTSPERYCSCVEVVKSLDSVDSDADFIRQLLTNIADDVVQDIECKKNFTRKASKRPHTDVLSGNSEPKCKRPLCDKSQRTVFNPVAEHYLWCPYISDTVSDGTNDVEHNVHKPWLQLLRQLVPDNQHAVLQSSLLPHGIERIRKVFRSWTSDT